MAYRDRSITDKVDSFNYCLMQVVFKKGKGGSAGNSEVRVLTVDNHKETIKFIEENVQTWMRNLVKPLEIRDEKKASEL
jgi:hypothetical protein